MHVLRPWLTAALLSLPAGGAAEPPVPGFTPGSTPGSTPAPMPADQDAVRRAVLEGRLRPLAEVMEEVSRAFPGRIVEMELEEEEGRVVYEFDILTPDGRLIEVDAEAATGRIIGMEESDDDDD